MRIWASALIGSARSSSLPSSAIATAFLASDLEIDAATSRPVTPGLKSRAEPSGNVSEIIVLSLALLRTGAGKTDVQRRRGRSSSAFWRIAGSGVKRASA